MKDTKPFGLKRGGQDLTYVLIGLLWLPCGWQVVKGKGEDKDQLWGYWKNLRQDDAGLVAVAEQSNSGYILKVKATEFAWIGKGVKREVDKDMKDFASWIRSMKQPWNEMEMTVGSVNFERRD